MQEQGQLNLKPQLGVEYAEYPGFEFEHIKHKTLKFYLHTYIHIFTLDSLWDKKEPNA